MSERVNGTEESFSGKGLVKIPWFSIAFVDVYCGENP